MSNVPAPVIGGYRVIRRLGSGPRADVELGFDPRGGTVALKVLRDRGDRAAFDREQDAVAAVQHPHVVALKDVASDASGRPVAVLERLGATSLAGLLSERGSLRVGEAVTVLAPIAEALDALRDSGVTHGRIGAAAVLFRDDGAPVLARFGGASRTEAATAAARASDAALRADVDDTLALVRLVLERVDGVDASAVVRDVAHDDRPGGVLVDRLFALGEPAPVSFRVDTPPSVPTRGAAHHLDAVLPAVQGLAGRADLALRRLQESVRPRFWVLGGAALVVLVLGALLVATAPAASPGSPPPASASRGPVPATPAQNPAVDADDPVAALTALLALRESCLDAMSEECLAGVDESGSSAEGTDVAYARALADGGELDAEQSIVDPVPVMRQRLGDAVLLDLANGAETGPASVLIMRTEAGWRIRDYLPR